MSKIKYKKEDLEELYKTKTIREIAKLYNSDEGYISNVFKRFGIKKVRKSDRNKPSYEELYDIYITKDYTYLQAIEYFKCTFYQFTLWLNDYNIVKKTDNKKEFINEHIEEIKDCYVNKKMTMEEIGQIYNISRHHLGNILRDNNIKSFYSKSSIQNSVFDRFSSLGLEIEKDKFIFEYQIDIYFPEKKIGIEFNGSYWHCELYKEKNYHYNKTKYYEEQGIFIYHIFGYEWDNLFLREKIVNQIYNLLGVNTTKIYARKCNIKEITTTEKNKFLEENHIQGADTCSIKLGLYFDNELVSIMTFTKPRFSKKYEWELSRFCSKASYNVIGGASKLFKYFVNTYNPTNILSYSDIAKTKGGLYETLGFSLDHIAKPNYVWWSTNKNEIKTRYQCQKHKLIAQGYIGDSEVDIMHKLKHYRIYDCGNKVWIWKQ